MVTAKKVRYIAIVNSEPRPMTQILITEEIISNLVNPNDKKKIYLRCLRLETKKTADDESIEKFKRS